VPKKANRILYNKLTIRYLNDEGVNDEVSVEVGGSIDLIMGHGHQVTKKGKCRAVKKKLLVLKNE